MSADGRAALLASIAEEHYQWVQDHVDDVEYTPDPDAGEDYNVWFLDKDSDPDLEAEFAARVGEVDFSSAGDLR